MKPFYLLLLLSASSFWASAQNVGINADASQPDTTAMLDVKSTTKGLLIPRMTQANRLAITNPATGLTVYQTDQNKGFWYNEGPAVNWKYINTATAAGFSAQLNTFTMPGSSTTALTGWSVAAPGYTGTGFNPATGTFTVPESGVYTLSATINFELTTTVTASLSFSVKPYFQFVRTAPVVTPLITGTLPILDVNIALVLTTRAPLRSGTIVMTGNVSLTAGDVVNLNYVSNGFTPSVNLTTPSGPAVVWSVQKL